MPAGQAPERALQELKDFSEPHPATESNLSRLTAPLVVRAGTGIHADLNDVERPVSFPVRHLPGAAAQVRSLKSEGNSKAEARNGPA